MLSAESQSFGALCAQNALGAEERTTFPSLNDLPAIIIVLSLKALRLTRAREQTRPQLLGAIVRKFRFSRAQGLPC